MDIGNVGFILGFISGEGCFTFRIQERTNSSCGIYLSPIFQLKLKSDDDILLETISSLTDIGRFRYQDMSSSRQEDGYYVVWRIDGWEPCLSFSNQIESAAEDATLFYQSDKYQSFKKWSDIVREKPWPPESEDMCRDTLEAVKEVNISGNDGKTVEEWMESTSF